MGKWVGSFQIWGMHVGLRDTYVCMYTGISFSTYKPAVSGVVLFPLLPSSLELCFLVDLFFLTGGGGADGGG